MTTSFSVSTESADSRGITLISSDGNTFSISPYGIRLSSYVKSFVEENPEEQELNVPVVDGAQLKKIVEFVQHHENEPMKTLPKPLSSNNMSELVQSYYANFVDSLSHDELAQMARAANFMGVGPLLHLCAAKIASYIRNKSPAEIRTGLGLSMNFSAEHAEKIAKENEWAKDLTDRK